MLIYNNQTLNARQVEMNEPIEKSQIYQTRYFNINHNHKIFLVLALTTLLLNVLISWRRNVFLEIIVLTAIPLLFYYERLDNVNSKYVGAALMFITLLDLLWLIFFTDVIYIYIYIFFIFSQQNFNLVVLADSYYSQICFFVYVRQFFIGILLFKQNFNLDMNHIHFIIY
jgi:hypothetical protein